MKILIRINLTFLFILMVLFLGNVHANSEPTGIHKAAFDGDLDKVKALLTKNPQLLRANDPHDKKPLHFATHGGHLEVVKLLIEKGAKIDSQTTQKSTSLHFAVVYANLPVVKYLVSKGANINAISDSGTPVFYAAIVNKPKILKYLIQKGADITYRNENGYGVLHCAAARLNSTEIIELLIKKGLSVNAKNLDGDTPLHNAIYAGNHDIVKLLISKGANVNAFSKKAPPPLYYAVDNGKKEIIPILLESGSKVNSINQKTKQTALHRAAINGYGKVVSTLIEKGADLNVKDSLGHTPLYYACRYGHKTVAKILNSKGAKWTEDAKKEKEMNNFAHSPLLQKKIKPGSALIWYLGHSGFAVKTTNHLLIFDYFKFRTLPDSLLLANGSINPDELKNLNVTVFSTHSHGDHYSPEIFKWRNTINKITYIMGFEPEKQKGYTFIGPRQTKKINDMEITTIESNDSGVGFFVRVDGVSVFHPGDHANRQRDFSGPFKKEIEFLAEKGLKPDIFYAPVSGCGFRDFEAVKKGVFYTIKSLSPKIMVPMHSAGSEDDYIKLAQKTQEAGFKIPICCAAESGDWSFLHQGQVKKSRFKVFDNVCQVSKENKKKESTCCKKMKKNCKKK